MHKGFDTAFEESQNFESINLEAAGISTFGNIPLIIISGVSDKDLDVIKDKKLRTEWMNVHNEL